MRRFHALKSAAVLVGAPLLILSLAPFSANVAEASSLKHLKLAPRSRVAPGVYVRKLSFTNASGRQRGYLVTANLNVPGVSVVPASSIAGRVGNPQSVTTTVAQQKAVAGINADQFVPTTGIQLGGVMSGGVLYKTPFPVRRASTVYVTADHVVHVGTLKFSGTVTLVTPSASPPYETPTPTPSSTQTPSSPPSAQPELTYPLSSINTASDASRGNLTLFTSASPSVTLNRCVTATGSWSSATRTLTIWGMWGRSTVHARLAASDRTLAGCGAAGAWLSANLKLGSKLSISYALTTAAGDQVTSMVSSAGLLVKAGRPYSDPAAIRTFGLNPESAMCVSQDGRQIQLVAVDGRQGRKAPGVTIAQLRELLVALHCYSGVVLDGGGSTSLAVKASGKKVHLVNKPSGTGRQRLVPDVILIKYKKP
jgi:exopolysaccharide biosynthesis protein